MADEITVGANISVFKSSSMSAAVARALAEQQFTMTGTHYIEGVLGVTTSAIAVPLGSVATPGWFWAYNADPTNTIHFRNDSGGADTAMLKPGEFCLFRWDDGATPYAIADSATCLMEYVLFEN